jgi:DNA-binding XRE family transcriptional regulator
VGLRGGAGDGKGNAAGGPGLRGALAAVPGGDGGAAGLAGEGGGAPPPRRQAVDAEAANGALRPCGTAPAEKRGANRTLVHTGFPARLRGWRVGAGLTVKRLARRAGLTPRAVHHFEAGSRVPSLGALVALADALALPLDRLVGRKPPPG